MKYLIVGVLQLSVISFLACNGKNTGPSKESISEIHLKRGDIISCGSTNKEFGSVNFEMTCNEKVKPDFTLAIELLHSFEYDEAEKAFAKVIDEAPDCVMGYWGVAMSNFHPLWTPPTEAELIKGSKAIEIANTITQKSKKETDYLNAIAAFYKDWNKTDHHTRTINFEKSMELLHNKYPDDKEAAIFYALSLDASADAADKTYANQKKAAAILNQLYSSEPNHPGIIHYLIHTYDYPGLAQLALPAARKYAEVAPSSAHALHMPSHIFTRLGLWDEDIRSNITSVSAAKCYAESAGIKGHWDEELHGLDYLVYAYLQKGENTLAKEQLNYLKTIDHVEPVNFKVAYSYAAIPSRFALENKNWGEAASLQIYPANFPWMKFPWQEAILHFARLLGATHQGKINDAKAELAKLQQLRDTLQQQKDSYKAKQVEIQIKAGEAWIQLKTGNRNEALRLMTSAADMEDATEKHPVTPGSVLPARELLGDMLLELHQNEKALLAYEAVLQKCPNRFNSVYGAGEAAKGSGNTAKADFYFRQLLAFTDKVKAERTEIRTVQTFLK